MNITERYRAAKAETPDALIVFRVGDFYELFHEDAEKAAKVLGLAITTRTKGKGPEAVPMTGFPYHSLERNLRKLMEAKHRVAIYELV